MMVTTLDRLKQQVRRPYRRLCESVGLSYASFRRWKHRLAQAQPAIFEPGPHKVGPLRLEELHVDLCCLRHGRQRSLGFGGLYRQYQDQISRRDLQELTREVRRELAQQHQAELRHVRWQVPGLVWSLDDAELASFAHHKLYLHQVQDLASRYKFTPWVGEHQRRSMPQEQLLQVHSHGFSQDLLSHPRRELVARSEVLHLMQIEFVVCEARQLRVIQRPDKAGNLPSEVA